MTFRSTGVGFEGSRSTDSTVGPSIAIIPEPLRTSFNLVPVPTWFQFLLTG